MSSSDRVNSRTPPPARCAWTRMPSIFHSTAARPPARSMASSIVASLLASMGLSGLPTCRPNRASASLPPPSAACAVTASDPLSITARRTSAPGTPDALATASVITPSSAPWRSSPESKRTRNRCSSAVAAPNSSPTCRLRSAADPFPATRLDPGERLVHRQHGQRRVARPAAAATAATPTPPRSAAAAAHRTGRPPGSGSPRRWPRAARRPAPPPWPGGWRSRRRPGTRRPVQRVARHHCDPRDRLYP